MIFKTELKKEYLKGRSIRYMANQLDISEQYLSTILNGRRHCSKRLAKDIGIEYFERK